MNRIVFLGMLLAAMPAMAENKTGSKKVDTSPNRIICRSEQSTGSRLASQKRCLTAQQWADQKLIDRQAIERAQGGGTKSGGQ